MARVPSNYINLLFTMEAKIRCYGHCQARIESFICILEPLIYYSGVWGGILMISNMGSMLTEIKDMSKEEVIAVGVGGLLISSTITHGEMISAMSSVITKAVEIGVGMWQNSITIDSDTSKLIVASASSGTILIYQKNKKNEGVRKERSRFEIIEDMLAVLTEEKSVKKTRIMQRAYLNWRGLQKYFDFLVEENFIAECNNLGVGSYAITEKGKELLKRLKNVKEILG